MTCPVLYSVDLTSFWKGRGITGDFEPGLGLVVQTTYYCLTAVNYTSLTIPLIPFQSKFPLSGVTFDGLASVLSSGIWNLEWYFHTRTIHIPFPGSILKHMCNQLAQEAEEG